MLKIVKTIISIALISLLITSTFSISFADINEINKSNMTVKDLPKNIRSVLINQIESKYSMEDIIVEDSESLFNIDVNYPNGVSSSVSFAVPIRFENENGEYEYIDTSMIKVKEKSRKNDGFEYQNSNNGFHVYYSKDSRRGINFNDDFILAVYNESIKSDAFICNDDCGTGKATYNSAFGIESSVEFINTTRGIKSNIVLNEKTSMNVFSFNFISDYFIPVTDKNNKTVKIVRAEDTSDIEYILPEIYAFDSTNNKKDEKSRHFTDDCYYNVYQVSDGSFRIEIVVSREFLEDSGTTYPVIIDPSVVATKTTANIEDTFTSEGAPSTNYSTASYMRIGYYAYHTSTNHKMYSYIRFKSLPKYKSDISKFSITNAYLKLTFAAGTTTAAKGKVWRSKTSWSESTLKWNNQPTSFDTTSTSSHNNCSYYNFNVTNIAKKWYDRKGNYGVKVTYEDLTHHDFNLLFAADGSLDKAPTLTINYYKPQKTTYKNDNQISNNETYDRDIASEYAECYGEYESTNIWDTPLYKSTKTAPSSWINLGNGNNCTNFVSQCLHEGGMWYLGSTKDNKADWYYKTVFGLYQSAYTWGGATNFYWHWGHDSTGQAGQRTYITVKYKNTQQALYDWSYIRETFQNGDVIQHINDQGVIHHSMILYSTNKSSGQFLYAQHTPNKINLNLLDKLQNWANESDTSSVILHRMK